MSDIRKNAGPPESQKLREGPDSHGSIVTSRNNSFSISAEDITDRAAIVRKLNVHIMLRFCLLTILNNMDRANMAFASPQMNAVLGYSAETYGTGSSIFFAGYMLFQIPSQFIAARVNLAKWLAFLLIAWGIVATSFVGLTSSRVHLYILRFLLGVTEAGTFPAMWAYLTNFYAGGAELAAAWGWIGAAQPLAQVLGGPVAGAILYADGFLGLRGYQWLFLVEGLPTIILGIWILFSLAPAPEKAYFLSPQERECVTRHVKRHKDEIKRETGDQDLVYTLKCWKVYAQGIGSGWAGILRYGTMFWTPLIIHYLLYGSDDLDPSAPVSQSSMSALLATVPFSWAALSTLLNARWSERRGKMYLHSIIPLSIGSVAMLIMALTTEKVPGLAFFGLVLSNTSQASNPIEWAYPSTYLHGYALTMGWAIANCISGFGGTLGPFLIGHFFQASKKYALAMFVLAAINTGAVIYFAVLLKFLPAKRVSDGGEGVTEEDADDDVEALMSSGALPSDRSVVSDRSQASDQ